MAEISECEGQNGHKLNEEEIRTGCKAGWVKSPTVAVPPARTGGSRVKEG